MAQIRLTPQTIRELAKQFQFAADESETMAQRLSQQVGRVETEWEGLTRQHFFAEYHHWLNSARHSSQALRNIGRELNAIAERFEEADRPGEANATNPE